LFLGDKVLRDAEKEPTATLMWSKLESLYMTKSLAHRQFLNQQLYSLGLRDAHFLQVRPSKWVLGQT